MLKVQELINLAIEVNKNKIYKKAQYQKKYYKKVFINSVWEKTQIINHNLIYQ
jgi:hypothetical protein